MGRVKLMTENLRDYQSQPGYDHWECMYSACDECWNAPIPQIENEALAKSMARHPAGKARLTKEMEK